MLLEQQHKDVTPNTKDLLYTDDAIPAAGLHSALVGLFHVVSMSIAGGLLSCSHVMSERFKATIYN